MVSRESLAEKVVQELVDLPSVNEHGLAVEPPLKRREERQVAVEVVEASADVPVQGHQLLVDIGPGLQTAESRPDRTDCGTELVADDLDGHAELGELEVGRRLFLQSDVALFHRRHLIHHRRITGDVDHRQLRAKRVEDLGRSFQSFPDRSLQGRTFPGEGLVVQVC